MNKLKVYGLTCVLMMAATFAGATTIVMPTDEQLLAKAPVVVEGTVVSTSPVEENGAVWTETVVEVARALKGAPARTITVRELGGETADRITKLFGTPEFEQGEHVLLFLEQSPRGGYRTIDLFAGKFRQAKAANGRALWLRNDAAQDVTLLDEDFRPVRARNVQRDAAKFERFLRDRLEGRAGEKDYGVENPVLQESVNAPATTDGRPGSITESFTLISEPTVYRWFAFDQGRTVQWYSSGTQPGYASGGVSELQTAMNSWTGYSGALINYAYMGARSGAMGGLDSPNGVNEVLFNDPLNEISGTFSGSGVVGQGGFNGVSSSQTWNAPFAADASHPAGAVKAWNITEGNLTIQNGVTASNISSSRLAEIVAHEFGHTLGFGHSSDSTALMYYSVTGRGPSLRSDDQLAARWLYPNGSAPPPPAVPAAPSNVRATASGSNADLTWTDNASNETGFSIYLSKDGGSYSRAATAGTNATSARLSSLSGGSYRVYVVATNSAGNSSNSNTASFSIASAPNASFSVSQTSGIAGQTNFVFYDESSGTVTSRSWSFGDGATSTASTPSHVYASAGSYTVRLTVSNGTTNSQASRTITVTTAAQAPSAAFNVSPSSGTAGVTNFVFTDQSSGTISSRSWNFGDGSTATGSSASHVYGAAGTYTVRLTVSGSAGTSQTTRSISVSAQAPTTPAVSASFDFSPSSTTPGGNVQFYDRSSGSPTRWSWNFGDGRTSSSQNPSHSWSSAGTYTVTLTASNASTSSTTSRTITIASAPTSSAYRTLVSVVAQTSGVGGTSWRTELTLFNAGSRSASVTLLYLPAAGGSMTSRTISLGANQSTTWGNALLELFNLGNGSGALAIEATSSGAAADLRVTSRTFTGGSGGTYGQAVPDVDPEALERTLYVTAIEANNAYRTNIGLVNRSAATVNASLTLFSPSGSAIASNTVAVAPNSFQQAALQTYFPGVSTASFDAMTMRVVATSTDALSAYASVVDNATQDPIYVQAVPASAGSELTIPVVGRSQGAYGTFWRSDVTIYNPSSSSRTVTLRLGGAFKSVSIGGGDTIVLADVMSQLGLSSGGGALRVSWSGSTGPVVSSRTYTTANGGTYGQSIDPVASFARQMFVPGLRNDASYRTNVGFVNGGGSNETFTVRLLTQYGSEIGRTTLTVGAGQQVQYGITALFPNAGSSFTLAIDGDSDAQLFAYGSMIDNATGDPVFFAGR